MSDRLRHLWPLLAISLLIGIFLSIINGLGYFSNIDAAFFAVDSTYQIKFSSVDGILIICLFSILPALGLAFGRSQFVVILSVLCLLAYYAVGYFYVHSLKHGLPFLAPLLGRLISLLRGFGYHPKLDLPDQSKYGAFISYRRDQGTDIARLIRTELLRRGIPTFLDIDDLGVSHFDEQLLKKIDYYHNFILILTPGALEKCGNSEDWLAKEIFHAIVAKKNIIPVITEGFIIPSPNDLPSNLSGLPRYQAVIYSNQYFQPSVDKLIEFLKQST